MSSLLSHKSIRVKKSTHGHHIPKEGGDIRAVDALVDREQQLKHITKSLLHYYQGLRDIESATAKSTLALQETIQVPFHEGNSFLGEGGWQEVLYTVRDKTRVIGEHHSTLAATLDRTVLKELEGVRSELKAHISAIEKEATALFDEVAKERATSAQHLTTLQNGIDSFENSSEQMLPQHDPVLTHTQVHQQLQKQIHKENDAQAALIRFQQQQPVFESTIFKNIQSACKLYDEAKAATMADVEKIQAEIAAALQSVAPEVEYEYYSSIEGNVLDPNTPTRSVEAITFPGFQHASTKPLKEGYLERKKRFTKSYKESYFVLTPSGYLHERKSNDTTNDLKPTFSIFLPECSLGAPAKTTDKSHKFHIEGNKAVRSHFEGKFKKSLFGGKEIAYSFRARTHNEMMAWWDEIDKLSRDTKTTPLGGSKKRAEVSPIAAAVANVGYDQPKVHPTTAVEETPIENGGVAPSVAEQGDEGIVAAGVPSLAPEVKAEKEAEKQAEKEQTGNGHAVGAVPTTTAVEKEEEEEEDDEEGGSSAEEEDEEARIARTAPTTPAVLTSTGASDPLAAEAEKAHAPAEVLPTYTGDGTTVAEQEAAQGDKKKGGLFASIFGGSPTPVVPEPSSTTPVPEASTSTTTHA